MPWFECRTLDSDFLMIRGTSASRILAIYVRVFGEILGFVGKVYKCGNGIFSWTPVWTSGTVSGYVGAHPLKRTQPPLQTNLLVC